MNLIPANTRLDSKKHSRRRMQPMEHNFYLENTATLRLGVFLGMCELMAILTVNIYAE